MHGDDRPEVLWLDGEDIKYDKINQMVKTHTSCMGPGWDIMLQWGSLIEIKNTNFTESSYMLNCSSVNGGGWGNC